MLGLAAVLVVTALYFLPFRKPPVIDFLEYWSAARLEISGQNPYSPSAMYALETKLGLVSPQPLMMWNPPWVLPFLAPLALLQFNVARAVILFFGLVIIFFSVDWLWRFYGGAPKRRWIAWGITFLFTPAMMALASGQVSPVVLLGVVAFLWLENRGMHLAAGSCMLLIAFKPQSLYLLWVVLALCVLRRTRWPLLVGALLALGTATTLAVAMNPVSFVQYWHAWKGGSMLAFYAPPLGGLLRYLFGWHKYWLQLTPAVPGLLWLLWWLRSRRELLWKRDLPLLLAVSVCTTPYGWLFDQVVLLPALIQRAAELGKSTDRKTWAPFLILYSLTNVLVLVFVLNYGLLSPALAWTAPLWLLLYVGTGMFSGATTEADISAVQA